jgi:hypothetical protein
MPTSPTPIAALPTPPSRDDSANFATRGDAFLAALPTFRSETNAVATNVYNNAVEVSSNATTVSSNTTLAVNSANAAAGSAGATLWVSGTTYALGAVVWSPANGQIYRRIVGGAGTTDPSADTTNWTNVMAFVFSGGNAGLGTGSPVFKLDIVGNIRALNSGADSQVIITAPTDSYAPYVRWGVSGIRDSGILGFPAGDDALVYRSQANSFSTGTERFRCDVGGTFRIKGAGTAGSTDAVQFSGSAPASSLLLDSSGNFGLGVTPSAWGSGIKSFQVGNYSALTNSQGGYTWLSNNAFYDTAWKYLTTNRALYYAQDTVDGGHKWYSALSGTAGNAITFTQAMTLTASGNQLLGTTSETAGTRLKIVDTTPAIRLEESGSGGAKRLDISVNASGEAVISAPQSAQIIAFSTVGTERARITAGGMALFGTTNDYSLGTQPGFVLSRLFSVSPDNTASANNRNWATGANGYENGSYDISSSSANNTFANNAYRLVVTRAGTCLNTTGTYGTLVSDERLKQDITDANSQWDDIKAIQFRKFRVRQEVAEQGDEALVRLGVIAQEVKAVSPGLVTTRIANEKDVIANPDLEGKEVYGFKDSVLFWKAAVALQEAMTRIESLEAKVSALEAA